VSHISAKCIDLFRLYEGEVSNHCAVAHFWGRGAKRVVVCSCSKAVSYAKPLLVWIEERSPLSRALLKNKMAHSEVL
jgi:hypothetical protein